jgi:hypothetical protein
LFQLVGGDVVNSNFSNSIEISSGSGRPLYAMQISCINLIGYLFISVFDNEFSLKPIEKFLLNVFASLSFLCLFVSATRGYIVFGIILILGVFFYRNQTSGFNRVAIALIFFISFYFFSQYFNIDFILSRSFTIFDFADGDVTADGTNARLTERAPLVYEKFYKSVLFGLGFSEESLLTFDGHVAIPSTLLVGGIFGLGITINFFLGFIKYSFKYNRLLYFTSVSILAYASIHLFSYMQWNYNPKVINSTSFFIFCSLWLFARFSIVNKKQLL